MIKKLTIIVSFAILMVAIFLPLFVAINEVTESSNIECAEFSGQ